MNDESRSESLIIMSDHRSPQANVSYIDQVIGAGIDGAEFIFFSGELSAASADLVHVHYPARFVGPRLRTARERAESARLTVEELSRRGLPLVQTLHGPHQGGDSVWRRAIDEATTLFISLDESTFTPDRARTIVIPHSHYLDRFVGYPRVDMIRGRLLAISPSRLVRFAPDVITAFPLMNARGVSLRVVGQGHHTLDEAIENVLGSDPSTTSQFGLVSDAMMIKEISAAELVILPDDKTLVDQSMLFLALSLSRPVLVSDSAAMRALAREVGTGWIHTYPGTVTAQRLDQVLDSIRATDLAMPPNLSDRDPTKTASLYAEAFRSAAGETRAPGDE